MIVGCAAMALALMMSGCGDKSNPAAPTVGDASVPVPTGATVLFSDGFGGDLTKWESNYMINIGDFYPQMRITTAAANTGTHSLTADSNRTALVYNVVGITDNRIETGVAGLQFYIMATAKGEINFSVQFGQNAGSSGGLGKQFGLGFDPSDSIKCTYYDMDLMNPQADSMLAPMQLNHWYQCKVEVNFGAAAGDPNAIAWYLDGTKVMSKPLPTQEMYGIDRLLVLRKVGNSNGPEPYYVDDIVLYTK
jgi:hypothetical protein